MSHTIIYQSMCLKFKNGMACIVTQQGDNNCTELWNGKEVFERHWNLSNTFYQVGTNGSVLQPITELPNAIHATLASFSGNNFEEFTSWAMNYRGNFVKYSFMENHLKNALRRRMVTAETLFKRYTKLDIWLGGNTSYCVTSADDLYNFLVSKNVHSCHLDLPRTLLVADLVQADAGNKREEDKLATFYYVYNTMDNGIYTKDGRKLVIYCLNRRMESEQNFNIHNLTPELDQYLYTPALRGMTFKGHPERKVLKFKTLNACVKYFAERTTSTYELQHLRYCYIGKSGVVNVESDETNLYNYVSQMVMLK